MRGDLAIAVWALVSSMSAFGTDLPNPRTYFKDKELCAKWFSLVDPGRFRELRDEAHARVQRIHMDEEIRVEAPQQCITGALNTCLGIAVINIRTKTAYLLHHSGSGLDYQDFLAKPLQEAREPAELRVALVGYVLAEAKFEDNYEPDFPLEVVKHLESKGIKRENIATALGNRGNADGYYSVRVDPQSGQVVAAFKPR